MRGPAPDQSVSTPVSDDLLLRSGPRNPGQSTPWVRVHRFVKGAVAASEACPGGPVPAPVRPLGTQPIMAAIIAVNSRTRKSRMPRPNSRCSPKGDFHDRVRNYTSLSRARKTRQPRRPDTADLPSPHAPLEEQGQLRLRRPFDRGSLGVCASGTYSATHRPTRDARAAGMVIEPTTSVVLSRPQAMDRKTESRVHGRGESVKLVVRPVTRTALPRCR